MAESEARDLVLVRVEDLHRPAGSKRLWEEEHERTDLGTCCLILCAASGKYGLRTDRHSRMSIDKLRRFFVKQGVHSCW